MNKQDAYAALRAACGYRDVLCHKQCGMHFAAGGLAAR
jgi:hypothetical protein